MLNNGNGINLKKSKDGKLSIVEFEIAKPNNFEKRCRQFPSIAMNLPKGVEYRQIFAAGEQALDLYLNYQKGDTIVALAKKVPMTVPGFGVEEFLWIKELTKVRSSFTQTSKNAISTDNIQLSQIIESRKKGGRYFMADKFDPGYRDSK